MVLFDADYPYPKVYSDFCYQKSITRIISPVTLDATVQVAWMYYSTHKDDFPDGSFNIFVSPLKRVSPRLYYRESDHRVPAQYFLKELLLSQLYVDRVHQM